MMRSPYRLCGGAVLALIAHLLAGVLFPLVEGHHAHGGPEHLEWHAQGHACDGAAHPPGCALLRVASTPASLGQPGPASIRSGLSTFEGPFRHVVARTHDLARTTFPRAPPAL